MYVHAVGRVIKFFNRTFTQTKEDISRAKVHNDKNMSLHLKNCMLIMFLSLVINALMTVLPNANKKS